MRIRGKLIAGLAAVAALTAVIAGYAALSLRTTGALTERLYDGPLMASDFAGSSLTQFIKLDRAVNRAVAARRAGQAEADMTALKSLESDIGDSLAILEERAQDAAVSSRVAEIKMLLVRWAALRDRLLGATEASGTLLAEKQNLFAEIEKQLDIVNEAAKEQGYYFRQDARRVVDNALVALLSVSAIAAVLALVIALLLARDIGRPVAMMAAAMTKLAGGDREIEIPGTHRKDEVGDMAGALVFFKDTMARSESMAAEQRVEQARKEVRQKAIDSYVRSFDSSVTGALSAFGSATDDLKSTAQSMAGIAQEAGRQAGAVATACDEASANVQTVATAAEELSASSAEISRRVSETAQIASQAVMEAGQTNSRVERLTEAAQKIGDVVKLINDIASQTNLLALNATIEAARAGEAGKGFAVVASEVKSLATQTAKATEDIAAQVDAIRGATGDAAQAIRSIGVTIGRVSEIATSIASAVEEQGAATREIARNVQQASAGTRDVSANIAGVTQSVGQTGESAARVLNATGALVSQSETLRVEVNEFLAKIRAA